MAEKLASATQKFIRMSPSKLRLTAGLIKSLKPTEALEILGYTPKRAAEPLIKVLKSAITNAKEIGLNPDQLAFNDIQIMEGPRLKRFRAVSRGRAHSITKKMSHVKIVLKEEVKKGVEEKKKKGDK